MPRLTKREQLAHDSLYQISYSYLRDNFHKFKESNKIRVATQMLQIFNKDDSKTTADIKQTVIMNDILKNGRPVRYNIGQLTDTEVVGDTGQVRPDSLTS